MARTRDLSITVWIDGECSFCTRLGRWLQRQAQRRGISLRTLPLPAGSTAIVVEEGQRRAEAAEALELVLDALGGSLRPVALLLHLLPLRLRQRCYAWVAQHRYRLFGRSQCIFP